MKNLIVTIVFTIVSSLRFSQPNNPLPISYTEHSNRETTTFEYSKMWMKIKSTAEVLASDEDINLEIKSTVTISGNQIDVFIGEDQIEAEIISDAWVDGVRIINGMNPRREKLFFIKSVRMAQNFL